MSRRAGAIAAALAAVATLIALPAITSPVGATTPTTAGVDGGATTVPVTPPTSPPVVTDAPTTVLTPPTIPGPTPRASRRVASPVAIEKIRATSLPLRTMGITLTVVVASLAAAGFVYGRIRSRTPSAAVPKSAVPVGPDISGPLPAPKATPQPHSHPLPPPIIEDAESDTVIFEPPPEHQAPPVIAATSETPTSPDEPADAEGSDEGTER